MNKKRKIDILPVSSSRLSSATSTPTPDHTAHTAVPVLPPNMVDFLGLKLTPQDAEVGLYVTFSFLLVSVLGMIFVVYRLLKTRKNSKAALAESVKLQRT